MVEAADVEALPDADPSAGSQRLAVGTDHLLYLVNSSGTKTAVGTATTDATLSTSDITTNNASTSKHGFLKKLDNSSTSFMNGQGNWATPSGTGAVASDTIWDAAGDLAQGTGANTGAKLSAGTAGQFLMSGGAAAANVWASRELDYVQITSSVNLTATTEGTAHTCITGTSQAYAAVPTLIEVYTPRLETGTSSGNATIILLYDGASLIGRIGLTKTVAAVGFFTPTLMQYRLTPTAATHQYIVKGIVTGGTGVFTAGAGGAGTELPAFLRITRV
jgi:hypothetical protein